MVSVSNKTQKIKVCCEHLLFFALNIRLPELCYFSVAHLSSQVWEKNRKGQVQVSEIVEENIFFLTLQWCMEIGLISVLGDRSARVIAFYLFFHFLYDDWHQESSSVVERH